MSVSFPNCCNLEWTKCICGSVPWLLLTGYKLSHILFPSLKIHGLWQAINSHFRHTYISKALYPVFVTYQVCMVCACVFRSCVWDSDHHVLSCRGWSSPSIAATMCFAPSICMLSSVQEIILQNHLPPWSPMCCWVADWLWYLVRLSFFSSNTATAWIAFKHIPPSTRPETNVVHPKSVPEPNRASQRTQQPVLGWRPLPRTLDGIPFVLCLCKTSVCNHAWDQRYGLRCKNFPQNSAASPPEGRPLARPKSKPHALKPQRTSKTPCYNAYRNPRLAGRMCFCFCSVPAFHATIFFAPLSWRLRADLRRQCGLTGALSLVDANI